MNDDIQLVNAEMGKSRKIELAIDGTETEPVAVIEEDGCELTLSGYEEFRFGLISIWWKDAVGPVWQVLEMSTGSRIAEHPDQQAAVLLAIRRLASDTREELRNRIQVQRMRVRTDWGRLLNQHIRQPEAREDMRESNP